LSDWGTPLSVTTAIAGLFVCSLGFSMFIRVDFISGFRSHINNVTRQTRCWPGRNSSGLSIRVSTVIARSISICVIPGYTLRSEPGLPVDEACRNKSSRRVPEPTSTQRWGQHRGTQQAPAAV
jgi:hypothetical protein